MENLAILFLFIDVLYLYRPIWVKSANNINTEHTFSINKILQ